jgi:hypothetical protein
LLPHVLFDKSTVWFPHKKTYLNWIDLNDIYIVYI